MEEEVEKVPASETGMTKLGASKRKRTSSGDGERGKLVLEVVEPAVEEPEEKASQIFTHVQIAASCSPNHISILIICSGTQGSNAIGLLARS